MEKEIELEQEAVIVYSGGGAVNSVNGYTGDVILTTSDLENTSDYQTGNEVESAISTAIAGKQDTLTAGNNITISNNTISATDTTYSAGTGLTLNGTQFSVDTGTIATQQDVSNEATARENADINLQGQIDAISSASDVTDIVGTYAALQAYDTTHLKDNDIIKVLQDESQDDETTYYRWSTSTQTFTLIGEEGPYYTKSQTDTLLQAKQDTLTAGSNITIGSDNTISATDTTYTAGTNVSISSGNVISATDTTYTAGTGLTLNGTQFSADTTVLATQTDLSGKQNTLTAGSNITISGDTISATDTTYSDFTGTDGTAAGTAGLVPAPAATDIDKFLKSDGTWAIAGGGGIKTLTTADYNYPVNNPTYINLGLFDPGIYFVDDNAMIYNGTNVNKYRSSHTFVVTGGDGDSTIRNIMVIYPAAGASSNEYKIRFFYTFTSSPDPWTARGNVLSADYITNNLTTNNANRVLSAAQGKTLKDLIDGLVISGAGAPTTSTVGTVGQLYEDTTNGKLYQCTAVSGNTYTWVEVGAGGGGGGPTVVQTTGTSQADVMSQNAATSMVFADPATATRVSIGNSNAGDSAVSIGVATYGTGQYSVALGDHANTYGGQNAIAIGHSARARNTNTIAIGTNANSGQDGGASSVAIGNSSHAAEESVAIGENAGNYTQNNTVSIGRGAQAYGRGSVAIGDQTIMPANSVRGTVSIEASAVGYGYNGSSNYRLLTGVYDPQSAHDAATKGYVDPTTDSSAPTTATVGRLGQIQIDSTTATAYMCVAVDTVTPAYTWKQITA